MSLATPLWGVTMRGFSHLAVAYHSDLTRQNHSISYLGGTSKADLRAQERVFTHLRSMADLHEVVDLDAASDASFADAGAIDAGVRLHFNIVFDDDRKAGCGILCQCPL